MWFKIIWKSTYNKLIKDNKLLKEQLEEARSERNSAKYWRDCYFLLSKKYKELKWRLNGGANRKRLGDKTKDSTTK
jgi:hypothetical protein